jgi:glycosyltransferase involved in cell wall biosynthesis
MNANSTTIEEREDHYIVVEPDNETLCSRVIDLERPPRVSFCIPTMNSERTLERCLRSIVEQDYPDIEIVIVDGRSSDATIDIARKYTNHICYDEGKLGSARQTSIDNSSGEIIAVFDSDIIIPHRRWLMNSVKYFNYSGRVCTVWPANVAPPDSPMTTRLYFNLWQTVMEERIRRKHGSVGGGNSLFLRKFFDEIGGVNKNLHWGEDFDWAMKMRRLGCQVVFIRDPLYHDTMPSLRQFAEKQLQGAETFTTTGFQLMGLSPVDIVYEQIGLGLKGAARGLLANHDPSWLLLPSFVAIRVVAYGYTYIKKMLRSQGT